jgi:hypothetical protein
MSKQCRFDPRVESNREASACLPISSALYAVVAGLRSPPAKHEYPELAPPYKTLRFAVVASLCVWALGGTKIGRAAEPEYHMVYTRS